VLFGGQNEKGKDVGKTALKNPFKKVFLIFARAPCC
jgi:hypothetical protein